MAPHAESPRPNEEAGALVQEPGTEADGAVQVDSDLAAYGYLDNRNGYTPERLQADLPYSVAEHILWAPRKIRVASIGAGASGIMLCYKKEKEFGDDIDLVVYDRKYRSEESRHLATAELICAGYSEVGGVWHANRYPGCRCDVPSAAYQYSFAPRSDWPRYYSDAKDIAAYYKSFAQERGYLDKYVKLNHEVQGANWNEQKGMWVLQIRRTLPNGSIEYVHDEVNFLVANVGVLNTWKWPQIPGRELFKGQMTHSADYDVGLNLEGKRVAVIGSGASSIQIIPAIQNKVAHLVSFYRTPQWISSGFAVEGYTDSEGKNFTCE